MTRVKGGTVLRKRHKKVLKRAKGFRSLRSKVFSVAKNAVLKARQYSFIHRKLRKRDFRGLWIQRISAALIPHEIKYSRFIDKLNKSRVTINRKMLADLAVTDPRAFKAVVDSVK
jgi:large subunit ribosomal protein L20